LRFAERSLSLEEARDYLSAPITDTERNGVLALSGWFRRRYPTPLERLKYVRTATARWQNASGAMSTPASAQLAIWAALICALTLGSSVGAPGGRSNER
jgi:hypothetical protein